MTHLPDPYAGLIVEIDPEALDRILTFEGKHYFFEGVLPLPPGIEVPNKEGGWDVGEDHLRTYFPINDTYYRKITHRLVRVERGAKWEPSK